jgi:GntR family transcriptional regulator
MLTRYRRIARSLRDRITSGELAPGSRLPTEWQLAEEWDVSLPTIRQAIEDLQSEGLVVKRHGIGTFVRSAHPRITYSGDHLGPDPLTQAISLRTRVEESEEPADDSTAALLRVPAQTLVTRYTYVSKHAGLPYILATVFVPYADGRFRLPRHRPSPWGCDFRRWLAERGMHTATSERVMARPPTPDEAEALDITVRSCALVVERTTTDADGRVAEAARLVLPGDRADAVFTSHAPHVPNEELEGAR